MSEKKQFRSEEARRNYETQEKLRQRAARRKVYQAKKEAVTGRINAWVKAHSKAVRSAAVAAAAALVLAWLLCKWFVGPGGSIPDFFGHLVGVEDNWLILNTAEKGKDPRYHHLADFDIPQGYEKGEFTVFNDGVQRDFYCKPVAEGGLICDFYIAAAKNMSGAEYLDTLLAYQTHEATTEKKAAVIAGKDVNYVYMTYEDDEAEGQGFSCLCIYMDTKQGSCVSAVINSYTVPQEQMPDEATLLAEAEYILAGLTIMN